MLFLNKVIQNETDESSYSPLSSNSTSPSLSTQQNYDQDSNNPTTFQTPSSSSSQAPISQTVTQAPAGASRNCTAPWLSQNKRKRELSKQNSEFENQMLVLLNQNVTDIDSDDLSFFQSLRPIIKKFTTYQKLLFRSEVSNSAMSIQLMTNSSASPLICVESLVDTPTNDSTQMQPGYQSAIAIYSVQPSASPLSVSTFFSNDFFFLSNILYNIRTTNNVLINI